MTSPRVIIDARIAFGEAGGIETVVEGLAEGFSHLPQNVMGNLNVTFLALPNWTTWLQSLQPKPGMVLTVPSPPHVPSVTRQALGVARLAYHFGMASIPASLRHYPDFQMNRLRPDLVHYPFQSNLLPSSRFVYHPHDLQHRHLPDAFTKRQRLTRDASYRSMCDLASVVCVASEWVERDLMSEYRLDPGRIRVVPLGPLMRTPQRTGALPVAELPQEFIFYPAVNWPHKNHATLMKALALLRSKGVGVPLVLSGAETPDHPRLAELARREGVSDLVTVLGFVDRETLWEVYERSTAVVIPTLFEASSLPIWEAFSMGKPVLAARVTSLPEQIGAAGLLFDPLDAQEMATCIERIWRSNDLRKKLGSAGMQRAQRRSWVDVAADLVNVYRSILDQ